MRAPLGTPRWVGRLTGTVTGAVLWMLVGVQGASAAEDTIGQTPPALGWIQLQDSRGIPVWNYELSLNRGGITSPDKFFWASITDTCWGAYRSWCALALWFLDWVLSFTWVQVLASPLLAVGDAMQQVVTRLGLVPTFLTLTALLAGLWMLKGRHTTAIWEVGIACVIAALASGVFAHPVELIAGQNGYIVKANQAGQDLAATLATGEAAGQSPEQLRATQTGQLVDTFIRQPTQMINFGRVVDGTACEGAYNEVIKAGPYGFDSDIRDTMGDCEDSLGEYAANPSSSMALGSVVFMPASFVILIMALILAGSVIAAAVWAMFQSLKAIVTLVTGLLPGGGRGSLMLTVVEVLVALLIIVFTSVFLGVFLLVIQAMFAGASGDSVPQTFVIVDIVIVVAVFVYWRQRKQLKATSQRLAQWMSQRPGGAPASRLPERQGGLGLSPVSTAVRTVTGLAQLRAQRAAANRDPIAGPTFVDNRQQAALFFGGMAPGGGTPRSGGHVMQGEVVSSPAPGGPGHAHLPSGPDRPHLPGGSGHAQLPGGPDRPQLPGGPERPQLPPGGGGGLRRIEARKVVGTLVRAGTSAALAYATGGASSAVTGASKAARVARTARRVALTSRMAAARSAAGASRPTPAVRTSGRPGRVTPMPVPTNPAPSSGRSSQDVDRPRRAQVIIPPSQPGTTPVRPADKGNQGEGRQVPPLRPRLHPVVQPRPSVPPAGAGAQEKAERAARLQARLADRIRGARRTA